MLRDVKSGPADPAEAFLFAAQLTLHRDHNLFPENRLTRSQKRALINECVVCRSLLVREVLGWAFF